MSQLRKSVDIFVKETLKDYIPSRVRAPKIFHDAVLGTNLFYPYEVAVLDLPLIQRLRRISQVGPVPLVFPSGNHNRFEHTLGVAVIAEKLVKALFRGEQQVGCYKKKDALQHARIAALLHDCGHGPFSHISEQFYKHLDDIKEELANNKTLHAASPHEALSYLIVTSPSFKDFFERYVKEEYKEDIVDIDLDLVGKMIVGDTNGVDPQGVYLVEIINGAFDADKLDYIQRDSHFTGIEMVLDLHRLFHTVGVINVDGKLRLTVDLSGVSILEQIVFNKMMLFSTVYHHQKVRAAESVFKSICESLRASKSGFLGRSFNSAADFLYITDDDIYGLARKRNSTTVSRLASDLINRFLPKRALVLSEKSLKNRRSRKKLRIVMKEWENPELVTAFRDAISEATRRYGKLVPAKYIWVDVRPGPCFKEGARWPIGSQERKKGYIRLRDVFPVDDWTRAFSENKWKGFVFTKPEYRKVVFEAAKDVLSAAYGIQVNKFARILCKMDEELKPERLKPKSK